MLRRDSDNRNGLDRGAGRALGLGVIGMSTTPLTFSVISGGILVMGLVLAGTLFDYRDAERAPTDVAANL